MELKIKGIWKEFGWGKQHESIFDYPLDSVGTHSTADEVLNYLLSGVMIISMRGIATMSSKWKSNDI